MLLLFWWSVKRESAGDQLTFVRCTESVASLDEVDDAAKRVCLQWAVSGSEKERHDLGRGKKGRELVPAD